MMSHEGIFLPHLPGFLAYSQTLVCFQHMSPGYVFHKYTHCPGRGTSRYRDRGTCRNLGIHFCILLGPFGRNAYVPDFWVYFHVCQHKSKICHFSQMRICKDFWPNSNILCGSFWQNSGIVFYGFLGSIAFRPLIGSADTRTFLIQHPCHLLYNSNPRVLVGPFPRGIGPNPNYITALKYLSPRCNES